MVEFLATKEDRDDSGRVVDVGQGIRCGLRARADLFVHEKGAEAAAEFRKITDHEGSSWGATWVHAYWGQYYALSYLGMAPGYVLAGEETQARNAYEKFLALWKSADPDLPVLRQSRAEYAELLRSVGGMKRAKEVPNP